jgi:hypothetical protein
LQIKDIAVPNFFDGWVHTTILEKLITKEAVPADRIYHSGFHMFSMALYHLSGAPLPRIILLTGQWLAVLNGLAFWVFLRRHIRMLSPALSGLVVYSAVLLFPAYLTDLGRYPYVFGLSLMFPAILSSLAWLKGRRDTFILTAIHLMALVLVHYGSVLIWFAYMLIFLCRKVFLAVSQRQFPQTLRWIFLRFALLQLPAWIILIPKLTGSEWNVAFISRLQASSIHPEFLLDTLSAFCAIISHDFAYILFWILVILALFANWPKISGNKPLLRTLVAVWPLVTFALIWLQYAFFKAAITSYVNLLIFLSVCIAAAATLLLVQISLVWTPKFANLILIGLTIAGIFSASKSIRPETILFTQEDQAAMQWIRENTPPNDTFLVQSRLWGNTIVPSDGGGWIRFLTGRQIVYPMELGELHDIGKYAAANQVDYIYLGKQTDPNFSLNMLDINLPHEVVYQNAVVQIISVGHP